MAQTPTLKIRLNGRCAGVLLHPTSLGRTPGCGSFGQEVADWIAALARHGLGAWQVLPLAQPDPLGSPYNAPSASAISSQFLDGEALHSAGLIPEATLHQLPGAHQPAGQQLNSKLG